MEVRKKEHDEKEFYNNSYYVKHLNYMLQIAKLKAQLAKIENKMT